MHLPHLHRHILALSLAAALAAPVATAHAQQVVADGDAQAPVAGDYITTEPVEPGNTAGHVFHAINGGSIVAAGEVHLRSEGMRAAAARAEGAGSRIELQQGSVTTTGYGAAGLSAADGGQIQARGTRIETLGTQSNGAEAINGDLLLEGAHITTRGALSHGVSVAGGSARVVDSVIEVSASQSNGLDVDGGSLVAERTRIDVVGSGMGVAVANGGDAHLRSVQINGVGAGAKGVQVGPGKLVMEDVDIHLSHERSGFGMLLTGDVEMYGGSIHAAGNNASAVSFGTGGGGSLLLDGVDMSADYGVVMTEGSVLDMRNSRIEAGKIGIDINQRNGYARVVGSSITTRNGDGIRMMSSGQLEVDGSQISVDGAHSHAVSLMDGTAQIATSRLHTRGENGHGLYADGDGGRTPLVTAMSTDILTEGAGAIGAIARLGGVVHLADSVVRTTGANAHGVLSGGIGEMTLANTHVRTEGEGAWAAVINDGGRLQIEGGSLVSARHGGVWLRSSRDAHLTLGNGAVVSGGNGIALALDAAVAGRFDVVLEGGAQMIGDIVISPDDEAAGLVPQSEVRARLGEGSLWKGSSSLLHSLALDGGSHWQIAGDARVGELQVRDSVVELSDGSTGGFNTLTIDGDLHSEGATFVFNGALAGDDSAIDRLHVRGDASGDAQIRVNNIGGIGAPTADGIALVQIDGASLASYTLAGRAVAGSYEYFLFQGSRSNPADGHWYLRSEWREHCALYPAAPECVVDPGPDPIEGGEGGPGDGHETPLDPPPVLRPETGAYLANQAAAVAMFAHGVHDRRGTLERSAERSAWAHVSRRTPELRAVGGQLQVEGNASVLQLGSDVLRAGNTALGVMLGSGRADSSVHSQLTGYSARGRVRGTAFGIYATWLQDDDGLHGAYLDSSLQRGRFHNRVQGIGLQREQYASRTTQVSLEGGYTLAAWQGATASVHLQPGLQVQHVRHRTDRHVESNGSVVANADGSATQARAGLRVFARHEAQGRLLQPYVAVNWLRSHGAQALEFNGVRQSGDVPRSRYDLQAGVDLGLHGRWGVWGGVGLQRGDHGYRDATAQMGLRRAW